MKNEDLICTCVDILYPIPIPFVIILGAYSVDNHYICSVFLRRKLMKKNKTFVFRLSNSDLITLNDVSNKINRSKSDTVRWALHQVANSLQKYPEKIQLLKEIKVI